jgi:hypothetical protein
LLFLSKVTRFSLARFLVIPKPLIDNLDFAKLSHKKTDVLSQVLETLNFDDKISIRRGECNTPIKVTFYLGDPFSFECLTQTFGRAA